MVVTFGVQFNKTSNHHRYSVWNSVPWTLKGLFYMFFYVGILRRFRKMFNSLLWFVFIRQWINNHYTYSSAVLAFYHVFESVCVCFEYGQCKLQIWYWNQCVINVINCNSTDFNIPWFVWYWMFISCTPPKVVVLSWVRWLAIQQ